MIFLTSCGPINSIPHVKYRNETSGTVQMWKSRFPERVPFYYSQLKRCIQLEECVLRKASEDLRSPVQYINNHLNKIVSSVWFIDGNKSHNSNYSRCSFAISQFQLNPNVYQNFTYIFLLCYDNDSAYYLTTDDNCTGLFLLVADGGLRYFKVSRFIPRIGFHTLIWSVVGRRIFSFNLKLFTQSLY